MYSETRLPKINTRQARLATNRLAIIFGNGTMYRHDKNLKRAKTPEINQIYRINRAPKARASSEVPKAQEASRLVDLAGNQIA